MNTDKSLLETQNQPSCLCAVISSFVLKMANKHEVNKDDIVIQYSNEGIDVYEMYLVGWEYNVRHLETVKNGL
jgi:hypothetical protein